VRSPATVRIVARCFAEQVSDRCPFVVDFYGTEADSFFHSSIERACVSVIERYVMPMIDAASGSIGICLESMHPK